MTIPPKVTFKYQEGGIMESDESSVSAEEKGMKKKNSSESQGSPKLTLRGHWEKVGIQFYQQES